MNCKNCKADCASKGIGCAKDCKGYIPKTNADCIRSMTDEEIAEWYWWMLRYVQGYTDSRLALSEWLKDEVKNV